MTFIVCFCTCNTCIWPLLVNTLYMDIYKSLADKCDLIVFGNPIATVLTSHKFDQPDIWNIGRLYAILDARTVFG